MLGTAADKGAPACSGLGRWLYLKLVAKERNCAHQKAQDSFVLVFQRKLMKACLGGKNNNNTVLPLTLWMTQIKKPFIFSGCVSPQKVCSWQPLIGKRGKKEATGILKSFSRALISLSQGTQEASQGT